MKKRFYASITVMAAMLTVATAFTQTPGLGTWNVISSKITFNKQWSALAEAQLRSQQVINNFNYYEYKAGIGYNFPKAVSVLFAMGHYATFQPDGNFKKPFATSGLLF